MKQKVKFNYRFNDKECIARCYGLAVFVYLYILRIMLNSDMRRKMTPLDNEFNCGRNGRHLTNNNFYHIFVCIHVIYLNFSQMTFGVSDKKPSLVLTRSISLTGGKPSPYPLMIQFTYTYRRYQASWISEDHLNLTSGPKIYSHMFRSMWVQGETR